MQRVDRRICRILQKGRAFIKYLADEAADQNLFIGKTGQIGPSGQLGGLAGFGAQAVAHTLGVAGVRFYRVGGIQRGLFPPCDGDENGRFFSGVAVEHAAEQAVIRAVIFISAVDPMHKRSFHPALSNKLSCSAWAAGSSLASKANRARRILSSLKRSPSAILPLQVMKY